MVLFKIGIVTYKGHIEQEHIIYMQNINFSRIWILSKNTRLRIALSRLRVSAHRLEIETGRWQKPLEIQYLDRKCLICKTLEDKFHFLLTVSSV
jgi:hypothetical protein